MATPAIVDNAIRYTSYYSIPSPGHCVTRVIFQYGLYGSFLGCLMYLFLGTCKEVSMGPTAIVSLMTYNTLHGLGPVHGTLLCFLTGVIQLLMGVVGLGERWTWSGVTARRRRRNKGLENVSRWTLLLFFKLLIFIMFTKNNNRLKLIKVPVKLILTWTKNGFSANIYYSLMVIKYYTGPGSQCTKYCLDMRLKSLNYAPNTHLFVFLHFEFSFFTTWYYGHRPRVDSWHYYSTYYTFKQNIRVGKWTKLV